MMLLSLMVCQTGCNKKAKEEKPSGPTVPKAPEKADGPAISIELKDPKVTLLAPTLLRFEVNYRFLQGVPKPESWYACEVHLKGAQEGVGMKQMQGKELKADGLIWEDVMLFKPGAKSFEMHMSEAPGKGGPYRKVSNVVSGQVSQK
jgi:hypothetical protein